MHEVELKVIDIDPKEARSKLKKLGAKRVALLKYKRFVFPLKGRRGVNIWLRVRTDGKKTTLTLKENKGSKLSSTKEFEVGVENFVKTAKILCKVFKERYYEENERELYKYKRAEITIDKLPFIPHYLEIEAPTEREVTELYQMLGIKGKKLGNVPASEVYKYYGLDVWKIGRKNERLIKKIIA